MSPLQRRLRAPRPLDIRQCAQAEVQVQDWTPPSCKAAPRCQQLAPLSPSHAAATPRACAFALPSKSPTVPMPPTPRRQHAVVPLGRQGEFWSSPLGVDLSEGAAVTPLAEPLLAGGAAATAWRAEPMEPDVRSPSAPRLECRTPSRGGVHSRRGVRTAVLANQPGGGKPSLMMGDTHPAISSSSPRATTPMNTSAAHFGDSPIQSPIHTNSCLGASPPTAQQNLPSSSAQLSVAVDQQPCLHDTPLTPRMPNRCSTPRSQHVALRPASQVAAPTAASTVPECSAFPGLTFCSDSPVKQKSLEARHTLCRSPVPKGNLRESGSPEDQNSPRMHDTFCSSPVPKGQQEEFLTDISSILAPSSESLGFTWVKGRQIGQGGFGVVYEAFVPTSAKRGTFLAVKEIELQGSEKQYVKELQALRKEVLMLRECKHANIVRYIGATFSDGLVHIFTEYMAGGSVSKMLKQFGPFSLGIVRRYLRDILKGLAYLHRKRIMHRDLKGANILINPQGRAKLADFGASRPIGDLMSASGALLKSAIVGSVYWMAPEVCTGQYSRYADIWSVGCTVLEMFIGHHPWPQFESPLQAIKYIANAKEPPPIPSEVPDVAKIFILSCCQLEPRQRPRSADLLSHELVSRES